MAKRIRANLSYSNVVASLALLIAISGGATAIAISAGKNSVTTKSIKPGNVTARDLGPIRTVIEQATVGNQMSSTSHVFHLRCPRNSRPLSGGAAGPGGDDAAIQLSAPTPRGWEVGLNVPMGAPTVVTGYVNCLESGPGKPENK